MLASKWDDTECKYLPYDVEYAHSVALFLGIMVVEQKWNQTCSHKTQL
jgi:hypothetical protein